MILTVDRAVAHYVDEIDVDFDAVQKYYDKLPHKNKRPLEECGIHISALAPMDGSVVGSGVHLANPERSKKIDSQAPPANILIFLGSSARRGFEDLDVTLKHELTHYAQNNPKDVLKVSEEELVLHVKLALKRGKIAKAFWLTKAAMYSGIFAGITSTVDSAPGIKIVAGYGLAAAALDSFIHRKKKRKSIYDLQEELHILRTSTETEKEAYTLSDDSTPLITAKPRQTSAPVLAYDRRRMMSKRLVDYAHKNLSLTPPLRQEIS